MRISNYPAADTSGSLERIIEQDEELWEFDTVKNQIINHETDKPDQSSVETCMVAPTVRPVAPRLPPSLLGLFDEESVVVDTALKPPLLPPQSQRSTPSPSPPIPPILSPPPKSRVPQRKPGHEFQFPSPPNPEIFGNPGPSLAAAYSPKPRNRHSPTRVSASSIVLNAHQLHSPLEAAPSPLPTQRPQVPLPPPFSRSRSANAVDTNLGECQPEGGLIASKPSLNLQASMTIMENSPASPLVPPIRPFVTRERSASSSSKGSSGSSPRSLILPGLKDAVKVRWPELPQDHLTAALLGSYTHIRAPAWNDRLITPITVYTYSYLSPIHL